MPRPTFTTPMNRLRHRLDENRYRQYARSSTAIFLRWQPQIRR